MKIYLACLLVLSCFSITALDLDKALWDKAFWGTTTGIDKLIAKGANLNYKNKGHFNWTPLDIAISEGHISIVELLIKHKADINITDYAGRTALFLAIEKGQAKIVELLLNNSAQVNAKNKHNKTALYVACEAEHLEVAKLLLKKKASVNAFATKLYHMTPLHLAASKGDNQFVNLLITHGATVNKANNRGFTPLYLAAQNGHLATVKLLLEKGASATITTKDGASPLSAAAAQGHVALVELLLQKNASPTQYSSKRPLSEAIRNEHYAVAELLIKKGANVNDVIHENGQELTLLTLATLMGNTPLVTLLLNNGADVHARSIGGVNKKNNTTALHIAAREGHRDIAQALIKKGAFVNALDANKQTPVWEAANKGHADIVALLIKHKADIQAADILWGTPLMQAAGNGHERIVTLLLDNGADINKQCGATVTALAGAVAGGSMSIVKTLLAKGADPTVNMHGLSLVEIAEMAGHKEIAQLLKEQRTKNTNLKVPQKQPTPAKPLTSRPTT